MDGGSHADCRLTRPADLRSVVFPILPSERRQRRARRLALEAMIEHRHIDELARLGIREGGSRPLEEPGEQTNGGIHRSPLGNQPRALPVRERRRLGGLLVTLEKELGAR
jgi:hypothetical protein